MSIQNFQKLSLKRFFFVVLILIGFFLISGDIGFSGFSPKMEDARIIPDNPGKKAPDYIEGEVLVKFKRGVTKSVANNVAAFLSMQVEKNYSTISSIQGQQYAHFKSPVRTTAEMIEQLKSHAYVESVSPNHILKILQTTPNDTFFSDLWGLHNIGQTGGTVDADIDAPEAWDYCVGSGDVIVAVIDSGIDYNHPDLTANMWVNPGEIAGDGIDNDTNGYIDDIHGINSITGSGDPLDDNSHGTHCAGTIGGVGNNSLGVAGVNWNVKLIGAKFLDASGSGSTSDGIECMDYLLDLKTSAGRNIVAINASFGGGSYNTAMKDAIDAAGTAGIIFCAAAGNDHTDNDTTPHYPSSYTSSNLIAVTATRHDNSQYYNYGATSVDIGAPGYNIVSTINGMYIPQSGDIFFDNMESGAGNWTTGGTNNTWAITTNQEDFANPSFPVPSPPNFWSDSPGADYVPYTNSWLMNSSNINLSGYVGQDLYIGFGSAMLIEGGYDHAYVEVSGNGGSTWTSLMDFSGYGYYWKSPYSYKIPDSVKTTQFRFRFHLVTDSSVQYWGWLIDDVGIGTTISYPYQSKNGTSMATPHVAGAVALMAARFPTETVSQRISRIYDNVVPLTSLTGKCTTGGMLNLFDSVSANVYISGRVTDGGSGLSGVTMSGLPGSPITDSGGCYNVTVANGWSGTVTPFKTGYVFSPTNKVYSLITTDQTGQDYIGSVPPPHTVSKPNIPTGPIKGWTGKNYTYTTGGSTCSLGHAVEYKFDWGDTTSSTWNSSTTCMHAWSSPGTYSIKVLARCATDNTIMSAWSDVCSVDIDLSWSSINRLSWTSFVTRSPDIEKDSSDNIYAFWQDDKSGFFDIYFRKSTDQGTSWGGTKRVTYTSRNSECLDLVIDPSDNLHLFWHESFAIDNCEIRYRNSTDGGASWSAIQTLTSSVGYSFFPSAAVDPSGNLYLVWQDDAPGNKEIYFMKSTDSGVTWSLPKRMTWSSASSDTPNIACDSSGYLHLVMSDEKSGDPEIYYRRSTDGGLTWSGWKRLVWKTGNSRYPKVGIDSSDSIHVIWQDDGPGNCEIYTKNSTNGGTTWSAGKRQTYNSGASVSPNIAFNGTTMHFVWADNTPGNYETYYKSSASTKKYRLTWRTGDTNNPVLEVDSTGVVHILWADDYPGNFEIYYRKR